MGVKKKSGKQNCLSCLVPNKSRRSLCAILNSLKNLSILGINTCGENKILPRTGCLKQNLQRLWRQQSTLFRVTILGSVEPPPPPPPPPGGWVLARIPPHEVPLEDYAPSITASKAPLPPSPRASRGDGHRENAFSCLQVLQLHRALSSCQQTIGAPQHVSAPVLPDEAD